MEDKEYKESGEELNGMRFRYVLVVAAMLLLVPALLYSIIHIQVVEGAAWHKWKEKQSTDSLVVHPTRGNIFSDDGALMASTMQSFDLFVDFEAYVGNGRMEKALADSTAKAYRDSLMKFIGPLSVKLAAKLKEKTAEQYEEEMLSAFRDTIRRYALTKKRVDYLTYQEIKTYPFFKLGIGAKYSGLYDKEYKVREKVFGSLASSTIGFINMGTGRGSYGLELTYDSLLYGEPGWCTQQKVGDRFMNVVTQQPRNGYDIYTTVSLPLQDIVEKSLREAMEQYQPERGTAILMEVKTGKIRAVSNLERTGKGTYIERSNMAVEDRSEPGSTFKTVAMMACLEEHRVKPTDMVFTGNDKTPRKIHGRLMTDDHVCGWQTAAGVIEQSSNIGMATLTDNGFREGKDAGVFVDRIYAMGFNKDLHLEFNKAPVPYIPHPATKKNPEWSKTDLPWMSVGYGVGIPPIYTVSYYNAIANDGCYLRPYFVDRIQQGDKVIKQFEPVVVTEKICSDSTLAAIRLMLDSVPVKGTAKRARSEIVEIAGKTGTAVLDYGKSTRSHQCSFCAYFPAHAPEYTCIVVIRRIPSGLPQSGGAVAAPVVKRIAEQVYAREHRLSLDDLTLSQPDEVAPTPAEALAMATPLPVDDASRSKGAGNVPDVTGLGLKDAIYLLEKSQYHVSVHGHGRVASQSPKAGTACKPGKGIDITLR